MDESLTACSTLGVEGCSAFYSYFLFFSLQICPLVTINLPLAASVFSSMNCNMYLQIGLVWLCIIVLVSIMSNMYFFDWIVFSV